MVALLSVLLTDKLERFLWQLSVLENLKNAVMQADQAFLFLLQSKEEALLILFPAWGHSHFLTSHLPAARSEDANTS